MYKTNFFFQKIFSFLSGICRREAIPGVSVTYRQILVGGSSRTRTGRLSYRQICNLPEYKQATTGLQIRLNGVIGEKTEFAVRIRSLVRNFRFARNDCV